jgi:hypothetical protein
MRLALLLTLSATAFFANAEGRCPPGQYPIGDERAPGCAPIPGAYGDAAGTSSPVPTGKWETRWGAIAEESAARDPGTPLATGVSESRKSEREATSAALEECKRVGGRKCSISITYHNQCVALADPTARQLSKGPGKSLGYRAETVDQAKTLALNACRSLDGGQECKIIYSACSMSEFKSF